MDRLSRRLGLSPDEFIQAYLCETSEPGQEKPWITRSTPCPFLKDNLCTVYDDRPADCRGYPYLYETDLVFRLMAMIQRTSTCPIVYEVIEELKRSVAYRDHLGGRGNRRGR